MKKLVISAAMAVSFSVAGAANAALSNGAVLEFTAAPTGGIVQPASGSWFSMLALDLDFDNVAETNVYTPISSFDGLIIGATQPASGSHSGAPDGTENPSVDNPWSFFNNTGMHFTNSPVDILSDDGAGNVTLDFSGWRVTWNGIPEIDMGGGGTATVTCGTDCSVGDTFTLDYSATVPVGDPSGFGGVAYALHLEGTVSAVPVPAAVWLFGSGLVGLVGVARRSKKA